MFGISEKIYNFVLYIKNKVMRKKTQKKQKPDPEYLLFIFGNFDEFENLAEDISGQFLPAVSSSFLKFTYGQFGVVYHFRSNETFSDLKEYVNMVLNELTDQYFLIELSNKYDINMDKKIKKDFMNIDGDNKKDEIKNITIDVDAEKEKRLNELKSLSFDFMMPIFDTKYLNNKEEDVIYKEPSVDEILDKITETGIESLTEEEKSILDNYGKRNNN